MRGASAEKGGGSVVERVEEALSRMYTWNKCERAHQFYKVRRIQKVHVLVCSIQLRLTYECTAARAKHDTLHLPWGGQQRVERRLAFFEFHIPAAECY